MSKFPFVTNEAGQKVFTLTCQETGVEFEHVQEGRGRPPLYSPEVRARRKAEAEARKGQPRGPKRKHARLATLGIVTKEGAPEAGQRALLVPADKYRNWAQAVRHARLVLVAEVNGDTATVTTEGLPYGETETAQAPVRNLVSLEYVAG